MGIACDLNARAYALAAALSLSLSARPSCALLSGCCLLLGRTPCSRTAPPARSREVAMRRALRPATEPAVWPTCTCRAHGASHGTDKQRATAVFKKEKRVVYNCLVVMKQSAADRMTIWWTEPPHVQLHVGCKEELEPCGEWLHVVQRFHPSDKGCVFLATDLGV